MSIPQGKVSVEEYERHQEISDDRLEFLNGTIVAMAGTTLEHEMIVKRLMRFIDECLEKKGCTLVTGNMRMHSPECDKAFLYPDIHIYCGEVKTQKLKYGAYALIEPTLIIEVLSDGTRNYDKGDKFECYRKIKSLKNYIMIESDTKEREAAVYVRNIENEKSFTEKVLGLEDILDILGCQIEIKDIYGVNNYVIE